MLTIDRQRSFFVTSPNTSGTLSWGGCHTLWEASGVVFASGMGGSGAGVDGGLIAASVLMDVFMSDTTDNTADAVSVAFRRAHTEGELARETSLAVVTLADPLWRPSRSSP